MQLAHRIWRSIFPGPVIPRTDRERKWVVFNTLLLHLRPTRVPAATIRFTHTFGLGGMSLVLVTLLMVTGVLMMFAYVPSPEQAYASIVRMEREGRFGALVRGAHYWSANLLVVMAGLHLLRVLFTGGVHGPRQFNWVIGCGLLFGLLFANFTGYLLPWDQLAYWAVTICSGMVAYVPGIGPLLQRVILGGTDVGATTLITFYTLHTTVLPVALILSMAWHFWRVRKAKGVVVPPNDQGSSDRAHVHYVLFLPHLLLRETAVALVLIAVVLLLAAGFAAPLGAAANPGMSPDPAKAPWYFLGFQELLLHFHPVFAVVLIPGLASLALVALPYLLAEEDEQAGRWFLSAKGRRMGAVAALVGLVVTPLAIIAHERVTALRGVLSTWPPLIRTGLLPFGLTVVLVTAYYLALRRRFRATRNEAIQTIFILLAAVAVMLTVTGLWFRGSGMALVWPW